MQMQGVAIKGLCKRSDLLCTIFTSQTFGSHFWVANDIHFCFLYGYFYCVHTSVVRKKRIIRSLTKKWFYINIIVGQHRVSNLGHTLNSVWKKKTQPSLVAEVRLFRHPMNLSSYLNTRQRSPYSAGLYRTSVGLGRSGTWLEDNHRWSANQRLRTKLVLQT